jgi:ABC-2 type transport system ATP-binding protein
MRIDQENDMFIGYLNTPLDADTLNRRCFAEQITLTHLVKRKESLEQQFLTLTNNQHN